MSKSPNREYSQSAEWPDYLDALVAAPDHHKLLFENERVRVLDTCVRSGDQTPVHTHRWPAVFYLLSWSDFIRYDDRATVLVDSRNAPGFQKPPKSMWSAPLPPHYIVNVGQTDLHLISVEIKD